MQVLWAPEAEETFDSINSFIIKNWGIPASRKFIKKTKRILKSISVMPEMFQEVELLNVRRAVIVPQSSVFYQVYKDYIWLLYFWDNRQEPMS